MKRFALFCLLAAVLTACAAISSTGQKASDATDPIVGRWRGEGHMSMMAWTFNANHTCDLMIDKGRWARVDDHYVYYMDGQTPEQAEKSGCILKLDGPDRLVRSISGENREYDWTFRREGSSAKKAAALSPQAVQGTWRFATTRRSQYSLAPTADWLYLGPDGDAVTTCSVVTPPLRMEGQYKIEDGKLKLSNMGPGKVSNELELELSDDGQTLLVSPPAQHYMLTAQWVYLRPDRFLPTQPIEGTWVSQIEGAREFTREEAYFADGRYQSTVLDQAGQKIKGTPNVPKERPYYALWPSPAGTALTVVYVMPELGLRSDTMLFERKDDQIILKGLQPGADETLEVVQEIPPTICRKK